MILSNTIDIRYKYKTCGMNTKEMAQLLKYYGLRGFLKSVNTNSFIVAVLAEDKAHNRKVLNKLKGVMASERTDKRRIISFYEKTRTRKS